MQKIMFNDKYGLTKAVLEGRKTQTRRLVPETELAKIPDFQEKFYEETLDLLEERDLLIQYFLIDKYGKTHYSLGETLAVALPYRQLKFYGISLSEKTLLWTRHEIEPDVSIRNSPGWKNKMFVRADQMPHQIRITNIRLERLQDITDEDCLKEGISLWTEAEDYIDSRIKKSVDELNAAGITPYQIPQCWDCFTSPKAAYAAIVDKISGKGTWEKNPWVFVYDFKLIK